VLQIQERSEQPANRLTALITLACTIALLAASPSLATAGDRNEIKRGNDFFAAEDWDNALAAYKQALGQGEDPVLPSFNLGDVYYRQQNYEAAEAAWSTSFNSDEADMSAQSAYNIGNARYASGDLEGALEAYITALQNNPDDHRTKYNLEQTLQQMQQQEQKNQDQEGEGEEENQEQQSNSDQQQDQSSDQQQQESEETDEGEESQPEPEENAEEGEEQPQPDSQQSEQEDITRRQQEQLLQSLEQDEKDILRELLKKEIPANRKVEKDW